MKSFLAVFAREVDARRHLLLLAGLAGLIPFVAALIPMARSSPAERRDTAALFVSLSFGSLVAFLPGTATLGRGHRERWLGFHFSRPISAVALWAGRLTAAWLLGIAAVLVSGAPTIVVSGGALFLPMSLPSLIASLLLMALWGDVCYTVVVSRSSWLWADLTFCLVLIAFSERIVSAVWRLPAGLDPALLVLAVALPLAAASFAACSVGRTDLRRAHGAQSVTLWTFVIAGLLLLLLVSRVPMSGP